MRAFLNTLKPTISSPHPTTEALGPILNLKMTKPRETIKSTKHIMKGGKKNNPALQELGTDLIKKRLIHTGALNFLHS